MDWWRPIDIHVDICAWVVWSGVVGVWFGRHLIWMAVARELSLLVTEAGMVELKLVLVHMQTMSQYWHTARRYCQSSCSICREQCILDGSSVGGTLCGVSLGAERGYGIVGGGDMMRFG